MTANPTATHQAPNLRKRLCAARDCAITFRPHIRTEVYCSQRCRNREAQRRARNGDEIQESILALRRGLNQLVALLSRDPSREAR